MTTLEIIVQLRRQAAELAACLIQLSKMRYIKTSQQEIVEKAIDSLLWYQREFFPKVRKAFSDPDWQRMDADDKINVQNTDIYHHKLLVDIGLKVINFNRKLRDLTNSDHNEDQAKAIELLIDNFNCWRCEEYSVMKRAFLDE